MQDNEGFLYYYDLLGLPRESLKLHYRFDDVSGVAIANNAPNFPQISGRLSSIGNFFNKSGSGFFTGQSIFVNNATGLPAEFWSHLFIFEKTGSGRGIFFDSLMSNTITSGYVIGINDANKLYFESYDQNGPMSKTSSIVLGKKNIVSVVKTNNLLTFYSFDFNNDEILSDNHSVNGNFILSSSKGIIGRTSGTPNYIQNGNFLGYLDEYVYIQDGITPSTFRYLVSGLCSDYVLNSGDITYITGIEVTGIATGVTGVTGVTGYSNVITGSGLDPFSTGDYELYWGVTGLTGYIVSGYKIDLLTGNVVRSFTGDPIPVVSGRTNYMKDFVLDEISYLRKIDTNDTSLWSSFPFFGPKLNLQAGYDFVIGQFQLDNNYHTDDLEVYLNGIAQMDAGYSVTGNFYGSGVVLSGDYKLDGFYLESTGIFAQDDTILYDLISGVKQRIILTGIFSGQIETFAPTGQLIYYNGVLQYSGLQYTTGISGYFKWKTNQYSGESGVLTVFPSLPFLESRTGVMPVLSGQLPRRNSHLFLNGQRQRLNTDYIENSSLDLIKQSGIFEISLDSIYNAEEDFFEDIT